MAGTRAAGTRQGARSHGQQGAWRAADVADASNRFRRAGSSPLHAALAAERLRCDNPRSRRIRSTLDADLHVRIESRVADWVDRLPPRTSAAVIVARTDSMEVLAYVGAARFGDDASFGHIDMARAWRSPGSTLKPFLYGLALDDGLIHSQSLLVDAPQAFGGYRPATSISAFAAPSPHTTRCANRSTCRPWRCSTPWARRASARAWRMPARRCACRAAANRIWR